MEQTVQAFNDLPHLFLRVVVIHEIAARKKRGLELNQVR